MMKSAWVDYARWHATEDRGNRFCPPAKVHSSGRMFSPPNVGKAQAGFSASPCPSLRVRRACCPRSAVPISRATSCGSSTRGEMQRGRSIGKWALLMRVTPEKVLDLERSTSLFGVRDWPLTGGLPLDRWLLSGS